MYTVIVGSTAAPTSSAQSLRDRLFALYRAYSARSGISPSQAVMLAEAACVLGSRGIPASVIRATIEELEAAFVIRSAGPENTPAALNSGIILEFPGR